MINKIIKPIFLGIVAAVGALVLELTLSITLGIDTSSSAVVPLSFLAVAALIEESSKFLVIRKGLVAADTASAILPSALLVGFGFALFELAIKNQLEIYRQPGLYLGILGIFFIHILTCGIIGYFSGKTREMKITYAAGLIFLASLVHFAYNLAVLGIDLQK